MMGKPKNIHKLSKEVDMTTSHLSNVTDQWQREKIIIKIRNGREVNLQLTKKGEELVKIVRLYDALANDELNIEEVK